MNSTPFQFPAAPRTSGETQAVFVDHDGAVTGIAGPAGGSPEKPVGLVWIAWGYRSKDHNRVHASGYKFSGGRDTVRRWTIVAALKGWLES